MTPGDDSLSPGAIYSLLRILALFHTRFEQRIRNIIAARVESNDLLDDVSFAVDDHVGWSAGNAVFAGNIRARAVQHPNKAGCTEPIQPLSDVFAPLRWVSHINR